jgi:hypothetical protein
MIDMSTQEGEGGLHVFMRRGPSRYQCLIFKSVNFGIPYEFDLNLI